MSTNSVDRSSETSLLIQEEKKGVVDGSSVTTEAKIKKCLRNFISNNSGLLHGLLAGVINPTVEVFANQLTAYSGPGQTLFYRYLFSCPFNIAMILLTKSQWLPDWSELVYIIPRCIFGALSCLFLYISFKYIPYLDGLVIYFGCLMLCASVLSRIWLSEHMSVFNVLMMVVIFIGVIVTSQPSFLFGSSGGRDVLVGSLWSTASGAVFGISICTSRRITKTSAATSTFYVSIVGMMIGVIELLLVQNFEFGNGIHIATLGSVVGILNTAVTYLYSRAFQVSRTIDTTSALPIEVPVAILLQYIVLNIPPNTMAVIGGILVAASILLLAMEEVMCSLYKKITTCI